MILNSKWTRATCFVHFFNHQVEELIEEEQNSNPSLTIFKHLLDICF
jgi:hypothetical protein